MNPEYSIPTSNLPGYTFTQISNSLIEVKYEFPSNTTENNVDFTYVYRNLVRLSFVGSYVRHPIIKSFQAMNDMTVCVIPMNLSSSFIGRSRIGVANIRPCDIWSFNGNFSITVEQILIYR